MIATALARAPRANGAAFEGGVAVTGSTSVRGACTGSDGRGDVECERVLLCAGIWGPTVGALAGVPSRWSRSSTSWSGPIRSPSSRVTREVAHPILRHQDLAMYFRHREDHYAVGNYHHEPIVTPQREPRRRPCPCRR